MLYARTPRGHCWHLVAGPDPPRTSALCGLRPQAVTVTVTAPAPARAGTPRPVCQRCQRAAAQLAAHHDA
jgi:hypothetical protein